MVDIHSNHPPLTPLLPPPPLTLFTSHLSSPNNPTLPPSEICWKKASPLSSLQDPTHHSVSTGGFGYWALAKVETCGYFWDLKEMTEEEVELKFRLGDGSDMGPIRYSQALTVAMLKDRIISEWPKDNKVIPRSANDIKLICSGKILDNSQTIAQCRTPFTALPGGVITMHVVMQSSSTKTKTDKKVEDLPNRATSCSCSIL